MQKFSVLKSLGLLITAVYAVFIVYKLREFEINPKYQGWGQIGAAGEIYFLCTGVIILLFSWILYFLLQRKKNPAILCSVLLLPCLIIQLGIADPIAVIVPFLIECTVFAFLFICFYQNETAIKPAKK